MRTSRRELILNPAGRLAVKAFRDRKPWKGTLQERGDKFAELHRGLCRAYDLETMLVRDDADAIGSSARSEFDAIRNRIMLRGRLSVVTYLFLFAAATGASRTGAMRWAREQFAHFFPRSFAGCREEGGLLVRDDN